MSKYDYLRGMIEGQRKWGHAHVPVSLETLTELLDIAEARPTRGKFRALVNQALTPSHIDGSEYSIGDIQSVSDPLFEMTFEQAKAEEDPEAPVQLFEADGVTRRPWEEIMEEVGRKNKALREREANGH